MNAESMKLLDDIDPGAVIEIDYFGPSLADVRTSVGVYETTLKDDRNEWVIRRQNRPDIAAIDVKEIRKL